MFGVTVLMCLPCSRRPSPPPDADTDKETWWAKRVHHVGMDKWYAGATMVMICTSSSAAAERVFSMLKAIIGDQQQARTLEDAQEAFIMAHYNGLHAAWRGVIV